MNLSIQPIRNGKAKMGARRVTLPTRILLKPVDVNLNQLITQIQNLDSGLKQEANKAVNQLLTIRNWLIGYYIVEYEQQGEDRAQYGNKILRSLSEKLTDQGLKGFSYTNLNLFRQFYLYFPEIIQTVSEQLDAVQKVANVSTNRLNLLRVTESTQKSKLDEQDNVHSPIDARLSAKIIYSLSFSHITLLLRLSDPLQRAFYAVEAIKGTWSVKELRRQMNALLFERSSLSEKPELLTHKANKGQPSSHTGLVKDLYTFEFLELPYQSVEESDLETALLDHLREFILELGNGFCLEARQKRILIGDEYFFIDLVFYHRILKCHVLIELKVEEFTHANAGQLNTYLNYYKQEVQEEGDNPPVGILLVTDKNKALVEYATAGMDEQLFVSKYLLKLPDKKKLEKFVREELTTLQK